MNKTIFASLLLLIGIFGASTASADPKVSFGISFGHGHGPHITVGHYNGHRHHRKVRRCYTVHTRHGYERVCRRVHVERRGHRHHRHHRRHHDAHWYHRRGDHSYCGH